MPDDVTTEDLMWLNSDEQPDNKNDEKQEQLFAIEQVIARRTVNNAEQMLIKWEGYTWRESTWEPRYAINRMHAKHVN